MLDIARQSGPVPAGFVRHDRCENGRKLGKTDPGPRFRDDDFIDLVTQKLRDAEEEGMFTDEDRRVLGAVAMYTATLNAWRQNVEPHIVNTDRKLNHELTIPAIRQIVREELAALASGTVAADRLLDRFAERLRE
jgi:hypothetical protein